MKHLCSTCRNMALRHACTDRIWRNNGGSMSWFAQKDGVVTACPEYKLLEGVIVGVQPHDEKPVDVWS